MRNKISFKQQRTRSSAESVVENSLQSPLTSYGNGKMHKKWNRDRLLKANFLSGSKMQFGRRHQPRYGSDRNRDLQKYSNLIDGRILQRIPPTAVTNSYNQQHSNKATNNQINFQGNHQPRNDLNNYKTTRFNNEVTTSKATQDNYQSFSAPFNNNTSISFHNNETIRQTSQQTIPGSLTFLPRNQLENKSFNKSSNKNNNEQTTKKGQTNIRMLTGTAEKIIKWHKIDIDDFCYYEIIGAIVAFEEGSDRLQKIMLLRDKKGPILQVIRYINDHINIEDFFVGQMLRCVGRMVGSNIMHGLSIREAKPDEVAALQRMCYICDHAISKATKK